MNKVQVAKIFNESDFYKERQKVVYRVLLMSYLKDTFFSCFWVAFLCASVGYLAILSAIINHTSVYLAVPLLIPMLFEVVVVFLLFSMYLHHCAVQMFSRCTNLDLIDATPSPILNIVESTSTLKATIEIDTTYLGSGEKTFLKAALVRRLNKDLDKILFEDPWKKT